MLAHSYPDTVQLFRPLVGRSLHANSAVAVDRAGQISKFGFHAACPTREVA